MKLPMYVACALAWLSIVFSQAAAQEANRRAAAVDEPATEGEQRHREGTRLVDQVGYFKTTGDRLIFHLAGTERKFLGLENLAMERVAKVVSDRHDHPEKLLWQVTGVFTEFRGNNYLLVTHAVLQSKRKARGPAVAQGR